MSSPAQTILIVDDEEQIRESIRGVLADEGYDVRLAENGRQALSILARERPALIVLDVWMPEMDGIELLREVGRLHPGVPVIVISGHGNIETAVRATQLGAFDFIEKPFSIESLLGIVGRALGGGTTSGIEPSETHERARRDGGAPAARRAARTLAKSVVINGHGLHSGVRTGLILHPAPPHTGVVFESLSSAVEIPALVDYVDSTGYATTLHREGASAKTVEHLLATLHAFGVTDLRIKMQGEIPILDGSALEFCRLVEGGGVVDHDEVDEWVVDRRYEVGEGDKSLALEPWDGFEIDYTLEYPTPVGREHVVYRHRGPDSFREEIAPARTFGFLRDIAALEQMGLAGGGRLNNCILIGDDGLVNTDLRLECEFARHKILDIMGDFFLLGRPIRGRIVARMTGHSDNVALLRKIRSEAAGG